MVIARGAGPMKSVRLCRRSCRLEVELEAAWCCWYYRLGMPNCAVGARVGRVQAKMTGYETRYSEFDVQHIPMHLPNIPADAMITIRQLY